MLPSSSKLSTTHFAVLKGSFHILHGLGGRFVLDQVIVDGHCRNEAMVQGARLDGEVSNFAVEFHSSPIPP